MKRFAVLGRPVAHSRSPQLHRAFGEATGIALSYEAIEVAPEELGERLAALHADGYDGLNLTLPLKVAALEHCVEQDDSATLAGATNTLVRIDAGWRAANTDGEGLVRDLRDHHRVDLAGNRVLVLGDGGAARGICAPLLAESPAELAVAGRTPWRTQAMAEALKGRGPLRPATYAALKGDCFDVVIHASSAGHRGTVPRMPAGLLRKGGVACDLSYGDAHAPFAAWARGQGAGTVTDGIGMLVEQAASAFALWTGTRPATAEPRASLRG